MAIGFGYEELFICLNAQAGLTIAIATPLALALKRNWKWWQSIAAAAVLCFIIIPFYIFIEDVLKLIFGFTALPDDILFDVSYLRVLLGIASCALVIVVPVVAWAYKSGKVFGSLKTIGLYALASSFWLYPYYIVLTLLPSIF